MQTDLVQRDSYFQIFPRHMRRAVVFWLLCIVLGILPVFASRQMSGDLVYCPLQKIWVPKGSAYILPSQDALGNICASGSSKQAFFLAASRRLYGSQAVPDNARVEALFFDYSKMGNGAFDLLPFEPGPARQITGGLGFEKGLANFLPGINKERAVSHTFIQPSLVLAKTIPVPFNCSVTGVSAFLSRTSSPRGPPISL